MKYWKRRPKIGGIKDPTPEEVENYLDRVNNKGLLGKMSESYFSPKFFERNCLIYEMMGVRPFKHILMALIGKRIKKSRKKGGIDKGSYTYFIGTERSIKSLKSFEKGTRFNELVHTPFTMYGAYLMAQDYLDGYAQNGVVVGLTLINFYCTILQRYNRARVYNTIDDKLENILEEK